MKLLQHLLDRFIQRGSLRVFDAQGRLHEFVGAEDGPTVTLRLHDKKLERDLALNPELKAAEAYMDGTLTFEEGSGVYDFLYLFSINRQGLGGHPLQRALRSVNRRLKSLHQHNPLGRAASNVRHHYDLSRELYELFLDEDLNYSCAYFRDPGDSLETAQRAKLRHATAKLALKPGMRVAEIGGGWGAFAIYLAQAANVEVVSINVSPEQIAVARERAERAGVTDRVQFQLMDYRELEGRFDRVVSVGMMEHVGVRHFDEYFGKLRALLKDDGFAFVHAIGRMSPPGSTAPFIRKYIFPGGYVPAMSEVFASTERQGLWVADMEVLRLHYAYTIRHWRERFAANREQAKRLYDERFCRMWEFYLAAVELGFLHGSNMVYQLLLSRTRDAVPIIRDYMLEDERALMRSEAGAVDTVVPLRRPEGQAG